MNANSTTSKGKEFEEKVSKLYSDLGYQTLTNEKRDGQQIDIIAERTFVGAGSVRFAIECKFNSKTNVSNQKVADFITAFNAIRNSQHFTAGIIITNTGFTPEAKLIAESHPEIKLLTISNLEDQTLLDVSHAKILPDYEAQPIFNNYITQSGYGQTPGLHENIDIPDIIEQLLKWLRSNQLGNSFVLGDYGSGKTTLLNRLRYQIIREIQNDLAMPFPVLFRLREFHKFGSIFEFVQQAFYENYKRQPDIDWLISKLDQGKFVLLLDGFDEISIESNEKKRAIEIAKLSPLLTTRARTIITCRPSYFVSSDEFNEIVQTRNDEVIAATNSELISGNSNKIAVAIQSYGRLHRQVVSKASATQVAKPVVKSQYTTVQIDEFEEEQILAYLDKHRDTLKSQINASPDEAYKFLSNIYDISDLMRRPLLLEMTVDTLLTGELDIKNSSQKIGPSGIYEIYTDAKLAMESGKGWTRQFLSSTERKSFSEVVAITMFVNGTLSINFEKICDVVAANQQLAEKFRNGVQTFETTELVANDVKLCSFLNRRNEEFEFSHRSFMEFFVARKIFNEILETGDSKFLSSRGEIRQEILYFLGSFLQLNDKAYTKTVTLFKTSSKNENINYAKTLNILRTLALSNRPITNIKSDIPLNIEKIESPYVNLTNLQCPILKLAKSNLKSIQLHNIKVKRVNLVDSEISSLDIQNSESALNITSTNVDEILISKSSITISPNKGAISRLTAFNSEIIVKDEFSLKEGSLYSSRISCEDGNGGRSSAVTRNIKVESTQFSDTTFKIPDKGIFEEWSFKNCSFQKCTFDEILARGSDISEVVGEKSSSADSPKRIPTTKLEQIDAKFSDCRGVIFLQNVGGFSDPKDSVLRLLEEWDRGRELKASQIKFLREYINSQFIEIGESHLYFVNYFLFQNANKYRDFVYSKLRKNWTMKTSFR